MSPRKHKFGSNEESQRIAALEAENWNLKYPVGTAVSLLKDSGEEVETKTRSEAYVCAANYAVIFLEDVRGYYLLSRVRATTRRTGEAV
jgi:hypothetical protein